MNTSQLTPSPADRQPSARRRGRALVPPEWRQCLELGAPIMLTVWVNMGMSVTDTWMVSRLGATAVAAVAVGSDLSSIVLYFFGGLLAGLMPALAAAVVGGDRRRVGEVCSALWVTSGAATVIAVPIVWFAPTYLPALGVAPDLLGQGAGYTRFAAASLVPLLAFGVLRTVLTAHARPRVFFDATLCALPLNVVFNAALIHGVGPIGPMGTDGAGLATFMTSCVVVSVVLWRLRGEPFARELLVRRSLVRVRDLRDCLRIGTPIGVTVLAEIGVYLGATLYLASLSTEAVAAHTLALKLAGIAYAVPLALAQVATLRTARASGAAERRRVAVTQLQLAAIGALLLFVALVSIAAPVAQVLDDGTEAGARAARVAWSLIWILALTELIEPFGTTAAGLLRGREDTFVPMLISSGAYWLLSVPLALRFAPGAENPAGAVWTCLLLGMLLSAVLLSWRLFASRTTDRRGPDG